MGLENTTLVYKASNTPHYFKTNICACIYVSQTEPSYVIPDKSGLLEPPKSCGLSGNGVDVTARFLVFSVWVCAGISFAFSYLYEEQLLKTDEIIC